MNDAAGDRDEIFSVPKAASAFGLSLVLALGCAHGEDLQAARACTHVADDAARLSCYDGAMRAKPQPASPPAARSTDTQARFGDDGRLHTEAKTSLPKTLSAQVRGVTLLPTGLYRLTLDSGQVWDTTEADSALAFEANDVVTISRRLLGGYRISLTGHNVSVSAIRKQ